MGNAAARPCGTPQRTVHRYLQRFLAEFFNVQMLVELYDTSRIIPFHTSFQGLLTLLAPTTVKTKLVCVMNNMNNIAYKQLLLTFFQRTCCAFYCIELASCHFFFSHFWTNKKGFWAFVNLQWECTNTWWHMFMTLFLVIHKRALKASLREPFYNHLTFI